MKKVSASEAVISWGDDRQYTGAVNYQKSGTQDSQTESDRVSSTTHRVTLANLEPGTRYTYWIDGNTSRFYFRTAPPDSWSFSFMLLPQSLPQDVDDLVFDHSPEFLIVNEPTDALGKLAGVRPFVPVITTESDMVTAHKAGYLAEWGGRRFLFLDPDATGDALDEVLQMGRILGVIGSLADSHEKRIAEFNSTRREPERVLFSYSGSSHGNGLERLSSEKVYRVDVSSDQIAALDIVAEKETVLWKTPAKQARTCTECRELANRGAYKKSIKAFETFINENKDHFQVDDAYFAIANLHDDKLYQFEEALVWYQKLLKDFPNSSLAPLAKQRIDYLSTYSEANYEPLKIFERMKKQEFADARGTLEEEKKLLVVVHDAAMKHSKAKIAPEMVYWTAAQYRRFAPDKAIDMYGDLRQRYPNHPLARKALFDIAETHYDNGAYTRAEELFRDYAKAYPEEAESAGLQLQRALRNGRRKQLYTLSLVLIGLGTLLGLIVVPRRILLKRLPVSVFTSLCVGIAICGGGWLIHEQFESTAQLVLMALGMVLSIVVSHVVVAPISDRWLHQRAAPARASASNVVAFPLFVAGLYLTIYLTNPHLLAIYGL